MEGRDENMETYTEQKKRHSDEFGAFEGMFWAFSTEQFIEGMTKIGLKKEDTHEILSIGAGGYMLKSKREDFRSLISRQELERKELKKNEKALIAGIVYELQNHEYCITGDVTDALEALGLTRETVSPEILKKAVKQHNESMVNV